MRQKSEKVPCEFCGHMRRKKDPCRKSGCSRDPDKRNNGYEMTFEEIGKELGCTGEAVRLVYEKAMAKMKRAFERENK